MKEALNKSIGADARLGTILVRLIRREESEDFGYPGTVMPHPRFFVLAAAAILAGHSLAADKFPELAPEQLITGKAKASPGIPGALLCRSHAGLAFAATQLRDGGAPDLAILGCSLLPEGTTIAIEQEDHTWIVRSHTLLGHDVSGVTDPTMIELESASP